MRKERLICILALLLSFGSHSKESEKPFNTLTDSLFFHGIFEAHNQYISGDYPASLHTINKALTLYSANRVPASEKLRSRLMEYYMLLGTIYIKPGDFQSAIKEYQIALELALRFNNKQMTFRSTSYLIDAYFQMENYEAVKVLLDDIELEETLWETEQKTIHYQYGGYYYRVGKLDSALYRYQLSEQNCDSLTDPDLARVYNAYGTIYTDLEQLDSAEYYLNKCLSNFETSLSVFERLLSEIQLNEVLLKRGKITAADQKARELYKEAEAKSFHLVLIEIYQQRIRIAQEKEAYKEAFELTGAMDSLKNSIDQQRNELMISIINQQKKNIELNQELQEQNAELERISHEKIRANLVNIIIILVSIILLFVFAMVYRKFRARYQARISKLTHEKEEIKETLDNREAELNELLFNNQSFENFFDTVQKNLRSNSDNMFEGIEMDELKEKFKAFSNRVPGSEPDSDTLLFNRNLNELTPALSENEKRLAIYIATGLNSKEIAVIFNLSVHAIETRRYRLRKKLQLKSGENLFDHLISLKSQN